jgi:chemotaxis protein methyltransferase CheR
VTGPRPGPGPAHDLQRFQALLQEVSGLELPEARRPDLQRAVNRALVTTGLPDADALYRHLRDRAGRPALEAFVGDLTIGETHFFRNQPQFRALERQILPELIERRRDSRRLRVWSAACSTGEEPYSLAILLERLLPDRARWDVRILATDINPAALDRARRGRYGAWSFREVPDDVVTAYFVRHGTTLEVARRIREAVSFAYLNLAGDRWPSAATHTEDLDLVLCRNVLIYFGDDLRHQVAARLHGALADGGWLLVAPAELSQAVFRHFAIVNLNGAVAYRKPPTPAQPPSSRKAIPEPWQLAPGFRKATPDPRGERTPHPRTQGTPEPHRPVPGPPEGERSPPRPVGRAVVHTPLAGPGGPAEPSNPGDLADRSDPGDHGDPGDGRDPLGAARDHLDRLELDQAEWWASIACQRTPLSAPAHYLRGLALLEAGRLEDALPALRRSVFLDPGSVLGQLALADLLVRLGEPARARGALRAATALVGDRDPAEPVDGHDGPTAGRVRDLIAARLARLDGDPEVAR